MEESLKSEATQIAHPEDAFKPRVPEQTLLERQVVVERKTFFIALKENHQGRFCRITEEVAGRRNAIILPLGGLADLAKTLTEMTSALAAAEVGG
jgi:hypothetical protein